MITLEFADLSPYAGELSRDDDKWLRSVRDFARKEWPLRGSVADVLI